MRKIVLDTEFAGKTSKRQIVEISAHEIIDGKIGKNFHAYVNPLGKIDPYAMMIHGLTNEFLNDKPVFEKIWSDFINFIGDSPIYVHQANSDISVLRKECFLIGVKMFENKIHCTQEMSKKIFGTHLNLLNLCHNLEVDIIDNHKAKNDSFMLAQCIIKMENIDYKIKPQKIYESKKITNVTQPMEVLNKKDGKYVKFYHKDKSFTVKLPEYPEIYSVTQSEKGYLLIKNKKGMIENPLGPCVVTKENKWITLAQYQEEINKITIANKPKNKKHQNYKMFDIQNNKIIYTHNVLEEGITKKFEIPMIKYPEGYSARIDRTGVIIHKKGEHKPQNPLGYMKIFVSGGYFMGVKNGDKPEKIRLFDYIEHEYFVEENTLHKFYKVTPKENNPYHKTLGLFDKRIKYDEGMAIYKIPGTDKEVKISIPNFPENYYLKIDKKGVLFILNPENNKIENPLGISKIISKREHAKETDFFEHPVLYHKAISESGNIIEVEIKDKKIYFTFKNQKISVDCPDFPDDYEITATKTGCAVIYKKGAVPKKAHNPLGPCIFTVHRKTIQAIDGNREKNDRFFTPEFESIYDNNQAEQNNYTLKI